MKHAEFVMLEKVNKNAGERSMENADCKAKGKRPKAVVFACGKGEGS